MRVLVICRDPRAARLLGPHLPDFRFSPDPVGGRWDLVIRWGCTEGSDPIGTRWLNSQRALELIQHESNLSGVCAVNRIPCSPVLHGRESLRRFRAPGVAGHYRVDLFDLATLAVFRWDGARYRAFPWRGNRKMGPIRQMARRALYAAGLHFGAVQIGKVGDRLRVLGISPAPPLGSSLARVYAAAFTAYARRVHDADRARANAADHGRTADGSIGSKVLEKLNDSIATALGEVVLGCDPEFVLRRRRTGRLVPASRFFSRWGIVGLDRAGFRSGGGYHHPIAELRPAPSPHPRQLVDNLRRAMLRAAWAVRGRGIRFEAGSIGARGFPIGGHIHFSNIRPSSDFLFALDNYLTLPLMLVEDPAASRARRPRYGTLGDFRMQPHGGFEYRTPQSWIYSPEFALCVLALAKIIANDHGRLRLTPLAGAEAQRDFYRARQDRFRPAFTQLWNDLRQAPSFAAYAEDVDLLRKVVEGGRRWHERNDIKRRWLTPSGGEF